MSTTHTSRAVLQDMADLFEALGKRIGRVLCYDDTQLNGRARDDLGSLFRLVEHTAARASEDAQIR